MADERDYKQITCHCRSLCPPSVPRYLSALNPPQRIKQGDLTDPDYFDFISFAQYATIAMTMRNGRDIFEEKVGAEGDRRTVQRDPDLMDNARLPEEHERRVGEKLLVGRLIGGRAASYHRGPLT